MPQCFLWHKMNLHTQSEGMKVSFGRFHSLQERATGSTSTTTLWRCFVCRLQGSTWDSLLQKGSSRHFLTSTYERQTTHGSSEECKSVHKNRNSSSGSLQWNTIRSHRHQAALPYCVVYNIEYIHTRMSVYTQPQEKNVCRLVSSPVSHSSPNPKPTCSPHQTLHSSSSFDLVLHFFSPSTQWHPAVGRDITEKQSRVKRTEGNW